MGMDTKFCPSCKTDKPLAEFARNRSKKDGLAAQCRECKKRYQRDWYKRNQKQHRKNANAWRDKRREELYRVVFDYLSSHPCLDCGETDPVLLDFDHVDGTKEAAISRMITDCRPVATVMREIEKCEVRCANCHRIRTAREGRWWCWRLAHGE